VYASDDSDPSWEPVGVLAMASGKSAKACFAAQQSVAAAIAKLAGPVKTAREAGVEVAFVLQGRRLIPEMTGGEEPEGLEAGSDEAKEAEKAADKADDAKVAVRKATIAVNQQMFKLFKFARNAAGDVNLAKVRAIATTQLGT
jgi:hypothetical protein